MVGLGKLKTAGLGRSTKLLAISVGESSLVIAQIGAEGNLSRAAKGIEFSIPPDLSFEAPEVLGAALGNFLRNEGFTTRRAVIGVPARWLLYKAHTIPPADSESAAAMLYLYATEQAAPELGPMVFDFAGPVNPENESEILLAGLQQGRLNALQVMARSAGLELQSVVPTGLALAGVVAAHVKQATTVWIRSDGAEVLPTDHRNAPRLIASKDRLVVELRRLNAENIVLWNDIEMDPSRIESLRKEFAVSKAKADWMQVTSVNPTQLSAIALGSALRDGLAPQIDFLHSKLAEPSKPPTNRMSLWLMTGVAALVLIAIAAVTDMSMIRSQTAETDRQLEAMQPALDTAKPVLAGATFVETFRMARPKYIACLKELTDASSADAQTTFANFHLKSDMDGTLSGKSPAEQNVLTFIDRLNSSGRFADVKCKLDAITSAGGGVSFSLTFVYRPAR